MGVDPPDNQSIDQEVTFNLQNQKHNRKERDSSSSEDRVNTSDEMMEIDCKKFIADCREEAWRRDSEGHTSPKTKRP